MPRSGFRGFGGDKQVARCLRTSRSFRGRPPPARRARFCPATCKRRAQPRTSAMHRCMEGCCRSLSTARVLPVPHFRPGGTLQNGSKWAAGSTRDHWRHVYLQAPCFARLRASVVSCTERLCAAPYQLLPQVPGACRAHRFSQHTFASFLGGGALKECLCVCRRGGFGAEKCALRRAQDQGMRICSQLQP